MARSTRSAATDRAYHQLAPSSRGLAGYLAAPVAAGPGTADEFDESDIWGSFSPAEAEERRAAELPRVCPVPAARLGRKAKPEDRASTHGSLPVNIPNWSKILGDEYRGHQPGDWELVDDVDDEDIEGAPVVPPHELAWRRQSASLSVHEGMGIGRTLKVRDAVWKKTGFQA